MVELSVMELPNGELLHFEQDNAAPGGVYPAGIVTATGVIDFRAALDSVRVAVGELFNTLSSLAQPPKTCELTFGLKLSAGAGFIVAKAQGEANFGVKMTWEPKAPAK